MIQGFKAQDTGRVIAFTPRERTARRSARPEGERGQVVILPVIRIERYGQEQAPEQPLASTANAGPVRRRRRRALRS
jgi:hypothetical protein